MVECAFGILKCNWWELFYESSLTIDIMPDVVSAYALLYNMVLNDKNVDIESLMQSVAQEIGKKFDDDNGGLA